MTADALPLRLIGAGPVASLLIDRAAKRNAFSAAMWAALPALVEQVAKDPACKVLVLRAAGAGAFSAGADIGEFETVHATPESAARYMALVEQAYAALAGLAKPTIAQIRGACFGGGCALALCCDVRYADHSARFSLPPARLGLVYSFEETRRLVALVGPAKAKEMLMGATVVEAAEAQAIGLVTQLFEPAALDAGVQAFADSLCRLSQVTIRAAKATVEAIMAGASAPPPAVRDLAARQFESADYQEGRRAFLAKRPPVFDT